MNELDDLVGAAEALHAETGRIVSGARRWRRLRERGEPLTAIVRSGQNRKLLDHAAQAARMSAELLGRLRSATIGQLAAEGWTRRQMASLVGVTHQRISRIFRPPDREPALTGSEV